MHYTVIMRVIWIAFCFNTLVSQFLFITLETHIFTSSNYGMCSTSRNTIAQLFRNKRIAASVILLHIWIVWSQIKFWNGWKTEITVGRRVNLVLIFTPMAVVIYCPSLRDFFASKFMDIKRVNLPGNYGGSRADRQFRISVLAACMRKN